MQTHVKLRAAWMLLTTITYPLSTALAQGTAFTYQGRLNSGANPAAGHYDLTFSLYNASVGGRVLAGPVTNTAVPVTDGLFTVAVDFGAGIFTGSSNWLSLAVRTNGSGAFTALTPLQPLTPTPYAITAQNLTGLSVQQNADQKPNLIGGASVNFVASGVEGATIGGGGAGNVPGAGSSNSVTAFFGTIGGGDQNLVSSDWGTIGGGSQNTAGGYEATIGGGFANTANGQNAAVVGGGVNSASGNEAAVGGGEYNVAGGQSAFVAGGDHNQANGNFSFAAGQQAQALHPGAFVWADSQTAAFASTANDEFSIRAQNGVRLHAIKGLHLEADNSPLIVRDWNPFASTAPSYKAGLGRWGLFMEPHYLTLGIPASDIPGSFFQVAAYSTTGTATPLLQLDQAGNQQIAGGLNIDQTGTYGLNTGTVSSNALLFGTGPSGSGEGIASQRTSGVDQFDLALYTGHKPRLTILSSGAVGIGTSDPQAQLHVLKGAGSLQTDSYAGGPAITADTASGEGIFAATADSAGSAVKAIATGLNGTGVYAASTSGSALTIGAGAIHVTGAGRNSPTAAFIQVATTANTTLSPYLTTIENQLCNGDPNAILIVTHNASAGTGVDTHPFSAYYYGSNWTIQHDDGAAILGQAFNVLIIKN